MRNIIVPLVDWGMGSNILIGFGVFVVVLVLIVYKMVFQNSSKE